MSLTTFSVESFGKTALSFRKTPAALKLHAGQVVEGRVVKSLSSRVFLVSVSGKQIRVTSDIPLPRNALLTMMVSGEKAPPSFRVMAIQVPGEQTLNPAGIRRALSQNLWGELMASAAALDRTPDRSKLLALFRQITRAAVGQEGARGVKFFVQNAGFSFENKLVRALSSRKAAPEVLEKLVEGDVKGLISRILADSTEGASALKGLYNALENLQLLNLYGGQETGKLFVPIPLQFQDGTWGLAQILFYLPSCHEDAVSRQKNDSEKKTTCAVTLMISLSRLGKVRAELKLTGTSLQGRMQMERQETLEEIEAQLPLLTRILASRGFEIDAFTCQLVHPSDLKTDLISEIISREGSSVCFVA